MIRLNVSATLCGLCVLVAVPHGVRGQEVWTADPAPALSIRGVAASGRPVFGVATWATTLQGGGVVVADASGPALAFFDASGALVRRVGRAGEGPGEFRSLTWAGTCGTAHVYSWDWMQARLLEWGPSGNLVRSIAVDGRGLPYTAGCARSGIFAFAGVPGRGRMRVTPLASGIRIAAGAGRFVVLDSGGTVAASLDSVPVGELIAGAGVEGTRPLGRLTTFALTANRIIIGTGESQVVDVYDHSLRRTGQIVAGSAERAPTKAMHDAAISELVRGGPSDQRARLRALLEAVALPERLPAYRGVFADPGGLVWLTLSEIGELPTRLRAFRTDGARVAELVLPAAVRVFEVGVAHVLGVTEDADGEQQVVIWRFRRPSVPIVR